MLIEVLDAWNIGVAFFFFFFVEMQLFEKSVKSVEKHSGIPCIEPRGNSFQLVICNSKPARSQVYHCHKDLGFLVVAQPIPGKRSQLAKCEATTIRVAQFMQISAASFVQAAIRRDTKS